MNSLPNKLFFTKGVGRHKERLTSFELALRDAKIEKYNLVTVSSIYPPGCKILSVEEGIKYLRPGEVVHCVMARAETNENNRLIAASIGLAIPSDSSAYGYLSEHHPHGENEKVAGDYAEDLAASMLADMLNIPYDDSLGWSEREQIYKMSGQIIRTRNITQSAEGKSGLWTSVISACVFADYEKPQAS